MQMRAALSGCVSRVKNGNVGYLKACVKTQASLNRCVLQSKYGNESHPEWVCPRVQKKNIYIKNTSVNGTSINPNVEVSHRVGVSLSPYMAKGALRSGCVFSVEQL